MHAEALSLDCRGKTVHAAGAEIIAVFIGCSVSDHVACVDLTELRCVAQIR